MHPWYGLKFITMADASISCTGIVAWSVQSAVMDGGFQTSGLKENMSTSILEPEIEHAFGNNDSKEEPACQPARQDGSR